MNVPEEVLSDLPDFMAWRAANMARRRPLNLLDYMAGVATADVVCSALQLVEPELTLYEGEYYLADQFHAEYCKEWSLKLGDKTAVQKVMNHLHFSSLIQQGLVTDRVAVLLASQIARLWSTMFAGIGLVAEAYGETYENIEITLYRPSVKVAHGPPST